MDRRDRDRENMAAAAPEPQDVLLWQCTKCACRSTSFLAHGAFAPAKRCRLCGKPLALVERIPASKVNPAGARSSTSNGVTVAGGGRLDAA